MSTTMKWLLGGLFLVAAIVGIAIYNASGQVNGTVTTGGGSTATNTGSVLDKIKGFFNKTTPAASGSGSGSGSGSSSSTVTCYNSTGDMDSSGHYDVDGLPSPECGFGF